ncbi:MAG: ABC transporter substrate-binding protein [Candidatus Krumholzibacteriia bacterium]
MALTALLGSGVATSVVLMQDATADPRRPGRCWKQAVLGLVVCAVLQALAPPVRAGRLPRYGGNIRVELGMLPANLDPASLIGEDGRLVASCLYEGLTRWGAAGLEPAIARGWVQSDDARRWVFHLRTDAEFHDGSPCDAEAISASFHHLADPRESRFAWILQDLEGWADFASGRTQVLEGVYVVSPSEIELQFTRPVPDLPARLAMPAASIVRWLGLLPIGTGPFRAVNVAPGTLRLVAFESYHEGRPFFDGIDFVTDADLELTP